MDKPLSERAAQALAAQVDDVLHEVQAFLETGFPDGFAALRLILDEHRTDDEATNSLAVEDHLAVLAQLDEPVRVPAMPLEALRSWLRLRAAASLARLAEARAEENLDALEAFMKRHGFAFDDLFVVHRFADLSPSAERDVSDVCRAFRYDGADGDPDAHLEVWEYRATPTRSFYLERWVDLTP